MKTNRNVFLLAFVAFVLSLILTSCAGAEHETTAEVRVVGTAAESASRSVSASAEFASAEIIVDDRNITDDLKPESYSTSGSTNDVEFQADVPVLGRTVSYSVEPRPGFVFDEWEFDRDARSLIRNEHGQNWMNVMREIMVEIAGDPETIEINPDYIKYIRPTFDRGAYFDASSSTVSDENADIGTKANPISDIDELISFINKYSNGRFDDDELTIKIRSGNAGDFNLDSLEQKSYYKDESEIELKLIGGYDEDWNLSPEKTVISSITFPGLSGNNIEELEIELRNIELTELDYGKLPKSNDDFEIDFRNCSVDTLSNADGKIVNGLVVETLDGSSSNVVFINSSAPYEADSSYYHSIVRGADSNSITGQNNIVLAAAPADGSGSGDGTDNLYLEPTGWNGYKTDNQELINQITTAVPLSEDFPLLVTPLSDDDDFDADDLLEEDIEGRERYLSDDDYDDNDDDHDDDDDYRFDRSSRDSGYRNIRVSYGPYEYQYFMTD